MIRLAIDTKSIYFEIANQIIQYAIDKYEMKILDYLYLSLTDHISFCVKRVLDGVVISNYYVREMQRLNPKEFDVGCYAIQVIQDRTGVEIPKDDRKEMKRYIIYFIGVVILATGLTLNTKAGLGVSPIISVPFSISEIFDLNFGNLTLVLYSGFIITEMILHKKDKRLRLLDLLQLPFSLIFTRFLNLFTYIIPDFNEYSILLRLFALFLAIVLTGIGAATMLNMNLIPNPGDGIVQAIATKIQKNIGFTKNCVDFISLCTTIFIGLCFAHSVVGVGLGTVLAMIGVGRVISVYQFAYDKMSSFHT